MMSPIKQDPEKNMDFWYSNEKWKDILGADEVETICVPLCLDVLKSWKREDLDEAPNLERFISGQKGEAAFMLKFQELNLGGILVSGLEYCDLEASLTVRKKARKIKKREDGEWDAIFFHQNRGIFVIEVKATETNDENTVNRRIEKAKTQLDRNIEKIKHSFLSRYQKECTWITGFICFPFRKEDRKTYEKYSVIDKSALNDRAIFMKFFEPRTNETIIGATLLRSFVAEFVCCRSQVEFHSQAYNAMQVATWIMEQDIAQKQDPTMSVNMPGNGPFGKIILTKQQLEIVECREKCVILYGAPGSGKTLILMLRALKAAVENKAGSVFIFVNEKLKAKYEHYFFEERDNIVFDEAKNIDRRPKIHTIDKINFAKPEDDVFFDETPVEDSYIEKVESRVNCSGSTTVVFTGLYKPGEAVASCRLYKSSLEQFRHFELMKVLRGTGNIFGKWKHYYPYDITIGHSIDGIAVKSVIFDSFERLQNEIACKIATLTSANISTTDLPSLKNEHIAVITCDDQDSAEMRSYFDMKKILCGKINEQARMIKDTSVVAVDVYLNTPSYEWPIVLVVLKPGIRKEEVLPIAASRCIASLAIFTYKNLQLQSSESFATQEIKNATESSIKADEREPTKEEVGKKSKVQKSLKEMYLQRFKETNPFSLPFTFDIENTWVSLELRENTETDEDPDEGVDKERKRNKHSSRGTQDHAELLKNAFSKGKMLIIEGKPARGKTSLMRRLAYEWAKGKRELSHFDLIVYAEFRKVRKQAFDRIADLVIEFNRNYKNFIENEGLEYLKLHLGNKKLCGQTLLLLDGYDESSLDKQCTELSTYFTSSALENPLLFNIVITTRPGYLSQFHGRKGRFVFAKVLGFTTTEQRRKYISNHFGSMKKAGKKIEAVHALLDNNSLNKLAKTPLFLTFICLVHERIVDGTLLELYCNIIRWLIDRHQQDFPDRDVPALFGLQNSYYDKFDTIQDHYLHFPQLYCLGNMALRNLQVNVFQSSDCARFNVQPIIEQVGLLRKEKTYDNSFRLATSFHFPQRTIQEFLAAFYYFCSNDDTSGWLLPNSKMNTSYGMNEFDRFLLRIALSEKMPVQTEKRKFYFQRIRDIELDIIFDAFNTTAGFNSKLLRWFLSQCTNVQNIQLSGKLNSAKLINNLLNETSAYKEPSTKPIISNSALLSFSDLMMLHSVKFYRCTLEANPHLSFTNCPSLKNVIFIGCEINSSKSLGIAPLPAIDIVEFDRCSIDIRAWQSITDQIRNSSVKCLKLIFEKDFNKTFFIHLQKCSNLKKIKITIDNYTIRQNDILPFSDLIMLHSVNFWNCTLEANSQLAFINCSSLNYLYFNECKIESSANLGIAALPAISTVKLIHCKFDLVTWLSVTDTIRNSSIKCLQLTFGEDFNENFLIHLQECKNVEKMEITIAAYTVRQNDWLSVNGLMKLHSLKFGGVLSGCTFEANIQLSFTFFPHLKILKFYLCKIGGSTNLSIGTLPAIDILEFDKCKIDLRAWQSITDALRKSSVKCLKLIFGADFNKEFLIHLQKCNYIENMEITIEDYTIRQNDLLSFNNLMKIQSVIFRECTFEVNSQLSITYCPSMKQLEFNDCEIKSITLDIETLPAVDNMKFSRCTFEVNSQLSFTNCPSLKNLEFRLCEIKSGTKLDIATLPAIDTVEFSGCKIDLVTWALTTDQIRSSSAKCLKLSVDYFVKVNCPDFLHHLQKCERIEQIHVTNYDIGNILNLYEEEVTANLAETAQKLPKLTSIIINNVNSNGRFFLSSDSLPFFQRKKEQIEKAGRKRNPDFSIKFEKESH